LSVSVLLKAGTGDVVQRVETAQCRQCTCRAVRRPEPLAGHDEGSTIPGHGRRTNRHPGTGPDGFFSHVVFCRLPALQVPPTPPSTTPRFLTRAPVTPALVSSRMPPPHVPSHVVVCSSTGQLAASVSACCNPSATRHPVATPASPSHVHELRHRRHRRPSPSPPPRRKLRHSPTAARVRFFVPQR
jgi:hypothetical protein